MISLPAPASTKVKEGLFEDQLVTHHTIRVQLSVLDQNEKVIGRLADAPIISGSVDMDATQDITRTCNIVMLDPNHKLHFDGGNPAEGALFADNFLQVEYGVYVDALDDWVDVPVFWGPVNNFERIGNEVTIGAVGKESLGLDPHLVVAQYTIPRGTHVDKAIKNVMNRLGERRYALTMLNGRLHKHRSVHTGLAPWAVIIGGGVDQNGNPIPGIVSKAAHNFRIFYDGRGKLTAKRKGGNIQWVFNGDNMLSEPDYTYDVDTFRNHVMVTGGKPKNSKKHYHGEAALANAHPLSPQSLSRHGANRQLVTLFESDSLKSDTQCRQKAHEILDAAAESGVAASFECLPVPHLEEGDKVRIDWENYQITFIVNSFSLPLTSDQPMTIGAHQRLKFHHRTHKTHHRNKKHH